MHSSQARHAAKAAMLRRSAAAIRANDPRAAARMEAQAGAHEAQVASWASAQAFKAMDRAARADREFMESVDRMLG